MTTLQTGRLTDSSGGTASLTAVAALADGSTYANDVAALRNNLATLTLAYNGVVEALRQVFAQLQELRGES